MPSGSHDLWLSITTAPLRDGDRLHWSCWAGGAGTRLPQRDGAPPLSTLRPHTEGLMWYADPIAKTHTETHNQAVDAVTDAHRSQGRTRP